MKKNLSGNQYISDTFSLCNYEINLNNTNNRLNYPFSLSLPYEKLSQVNHISVYEVINPISVNAGSALPFYGQYGGGIQYNLGKSIAKLIAEVILKRL